MSFCFISGCCHPQQSVAADAAVAAAASQCYDDYILFILAPRTLEAAAESRTRTKLWNQPLEHLTRCAIVTSSYLDVMIWIFAYIRRSKPEVEVAS